MHKWIECTNKEKYIKHGFSFLIISLLTMKCAREQSVDGE